MKTLAKIFSTLVSVGLFLAFFFYLGLQSGTQVAKPGHILPRKAVKIESPNSSVQAQMVGVPAAEIGLDNSRSKNSEDSFHELLKACLQQDTDLSVTEFIETQLAQAEVHREVQVENMHFSLSGGKERRIQTRPSDGETSHPQRTIKIFAVDSDGLPVPEKIPPWILQMPYSRQIHALSDGREPFFYQVRESVALPRGQKMDLEWINHKVTEFQWSGADFVFSCRSTRCHCSH